MNKSDSLTKIISMLLFAALVCYIAFSLVYHATERVQTALVSEGSVTESLSLTGVIVRQEEPILCDRSYVDVTVEEGERVPVGGEIAEVYSSAEAVTAAQRRRTLELQLEGIGEAMEEESQGTGPVLEALRDITRAVQKNNLSGADVDCETLAILTETDREDSGDSRLQELQQEYEQLVTEAAVTTLSSGGTGLYSGTTDGFEDLTPESLETMNAASVKALLAEEREPVSGAIGKLVSSEYWYYAAVAENAGNESLSEGTEVELQFGDYGSVVIHATVLRTETSPEGVFFVFSAKESLKDMLALRKADAELVYNSYSGLRVPLNGLYRYWAGYVPADYAAALVPGQSVTLQRGGEEREAILSEIGSSTSLDGTEYCQVVLYWPWEENNALPESGQTRVIAGILGETDARNTYDYETECACLCVFTITGERAERKKVSIVWTEEDYALLASSGEDALRAENEVILAADGLYVGKIFD